MTQEPSAHNAINYDAWLYTRFARMFAIKHVLADRQALDDSRLLNTASERFL